MPMQYMREQEQRRKQMREQKEQQLYFQEKEKAMMNSITNVYCRFLRNCKKKDNKNACLPCRRNENHIQTPLPIDNYEEKIAGLKYL